MLIVVHSCFEIAEPYGGVSDTHIQDTRRRLQDLLNRLGRRACSILSFWAERDVGELLDGSGVLGELEHEEAADDDDEADEPTSTLTDLWWW